MDERHLTTFQAVLSYGTLSAAARALLCAQSTISIRVQELEQELGARLFNRRGRRLELTEAGRVAKTRTSQIADALASLKEAVDALKSGIAGDVRFGAIEPTASHRLPRVLASFHLNNPGVRLVVEVAGSDVVNRLVAERNLAFAVSSVPARELGLAFDPLFHEPMGVLVSDKHPLASVRRVFVDDLLQYPILITDRSCAYRSVVESALGGRGLTLRYSCEVASIEMLHRLVLARAGIGIAPIRSGTLPDKRIIVRKIRDLRLALPVGLVYRRLVHEPSAAQAAIRELLARKLRSLRNSETLEPARDEDE